MTGFVVDRRSESSFEIQLCFTSRSAAVNWSCQSAELMEIRKTAVGDMHAISASGEALEQRFLTLASYSIPMTKVQDINVNCA